MTDSAIQTKERRTSSSNGGAAVGGGTYGLGFLGALVYFIQQADTFWDGVLGVGQAIFWPAFLVYDLLEFLGS